MSASTASAPDAPRDYVVAMGAYADYLRVERGLAAATIRAYDTDLRLFGRDARAGLVAGVSAAYGNIALVGIPLATAAYGDAGAVAISLIIAVHIPVMMTVSGVLIGRAERIDGASDGPTSVAATNGSRKAQPIPNPTSRAAVSTELVSQTKRSAPGSG